jgi:hypothetical protein
LIHKRDKLPFQVTPQTKPNFLLVKKRNKTEKSTSAFKRSRFFSIRIDRFPSTSLSSIQFSSEDVFVGEYLPKGSRRE